MEIIDKDPRLKPGMSCDVDIILAREDSVNYLPVESVYKKKEGSKEDGNEILRNIIYVKAKVDTTKKKNLLAIFKKKPDPLDAFTEREIEVGIKSENRIHILVDMIDIKLLHKILGYLLLYFRDLI